jgi:ribonuclease D
MPVHLIEGDLSPDLLEAYLESEYLAIDTETMGLNPHRDRLCLIQLCNEHDRVTVIRVTTLAMPRLVELLTAERPMKIFHFGRFDLAMLRKNLGVRVESLYDTKVASKLARTYTQAHGLKDLVRDVLGFTLDKSAQQTDWGSPNLSSQQLEYSANDVRYLIQLKSRLDEMLIREGRMELAQKCFKHLPTLAELDLAGWQDLFEH